MKTDLSINEALTTARWTLLNSTMPWSAGVNAAMLALLSDRLGFPPPSDGKDFRDANDVFLPIAPLPSKDSPFIFGLYRGHGRPVDEGNVGFGGVSEEDYNEVLMQMVAARLTKRGIANYMVMDYPPKGYEEAMLWVARHAKDAGATAVSEFHYNAFDKTKRGHEVLHWQNSKRGVELARCQEDAMRFLPNPSRGLKAKSARDRGALFLSLTHCPATILEPFFGDNKEDWNFFSSDEGLNLLADMITDGIVIFKNSLEGAA